MMKQVKTNLVLMSQQVMDCVDGQPDSAQISYVSCLRRSKRVASRGSYRAPSDGQSMQCQHIHY